MNGILEMEVPCVPFYKVDILTHIVPSRCWAFWVQSSIHDGSNGNIHVDPHFNRRETWAGQTPPTGVIPHPELAAEPCECVLGQRGLLNNLENRLCSWPLTPHKPKCLRRPYKWNQAVCNPWSLEACSSQKHFLEGLSMLYYASVVHCFFFFFFNCWKVFQDLTVPQNFLPFHPVRNLGLSPVWGDY